MFFDGGWARAELEAVPAQWGGRLEVGNWPVRRWRGEVVLFPGRRGVLTVRAVEWRFAQLQRKAGARETYRIHGLRHTTAPTWSTAASGCPPSGDALDAAASRPRRGTPCWDAEYRIWRGRCVGCGLNDRPAVDGRTCIRSAVAPLRTGVDPCLRRFQEVLKRSGVQALTFNHGGCA